MRLTQDHGGTAYLADKYRAIYMTLWRMDRRHYSLRTGSPANDSGNSELAGV